MFRGRGGYWYATTGCFIAFDAMLTYNTFPAAVFLIEEENEFNMRIDNPIEKREALYAG